MTLAAAWKVLEGDKTGGRDISEEAVAEIQLTGDGG